MSPAKAAKGGSSHEFDLSWRMLLARMETEWGESGAATCIKGNIVQVAGDRIQAKWQSDPSAVPPAYTAYTEGALESRWRSLKSAFGGSRRQHDTAQSMQDVVGAKAHGEFSLKCFARWRASSR